MSHTVPLNFAGRLLRNSRFYILLASLVLSGLVYQWVSTTIMDSSLRSIRLEQIYGFLSIGFLYVALLATPLLKISAAFPGRAAYFHARRAIGVAAFYFAALHVAISFFGQLEGFAGIGFLTRPYIVSLVLGLLALIVLFLMTITSLDIAIKKMTFPRWKLLHRFAYPAGLAILVHVVLIGTHFSELSATIPRVLLVALLVLLLLEAVRFDRFVRVKWPGRAYLSVMGLALLAVGFGYIASFSVSPSGNAGASLNVHAQHIQLAEQAQAGNTALGSTTNLPNSPSYSGDRTKRYTVSFEHGQVTPGQDTQLEFRIFDASNGSTDFNLLPLYTKLAHLVIVDDSLNYFSHIHPLPNSGLSDLIVSTSFPHPGRYRLYLNYQPSGAIEQQVGFSLVVGNDDNATASQPVDKQLTKPFGNYDVRLQSNSYSASKLTLGQQKLSFKLYNKDTSPVTTLKPYLGAFGHLVMVNETNYDYVHVHPYSTQQLEPNAVGGPTVDFLPIGIYGPIKPGIYRVFAEFNPDHHLITADFTVKVGP